MSVLLPSALDRQLSRGTYLVHPFESVAAVTVLIDPAIRSAMVRKEHQTSMVALRCVCEQIEGRIVVEQEVLGVASLGTDHVWSLDRVAAEEYWKVESDDIVVALAGVELDCETSGIASLVRELSTKCDRGESNEGGSSLARTLEEIGLGHIGDVCRGLEVSKCARASRVDHSFKVLRTVEGLLLLHEVNIRHHGNATDSLAV